MSRKTNLPIVYISAVTNAILINLQLLHITHLNWWFVLSPTWFVFIITLTKTARTPVKNTLKVLRPFNAFIKTAFLQIS